MRINYPEEITRELEEVGRFLVFDRQKMENVVRADAPEGTQERYDAVRAKMHEFKRQHFGV